MRFMLQPRVHRICAASIQVRSFACQPAGLFSACENDRPLKYAQHRKDLVTKWVKWRIERDEFLTAKEQKDATDAATATLADVGEVKPSWKDLPKKSFPRSFALQLRASAEIPMNVGNIKRLSRRFSRFGPVLHVLIPPNNRSTAMIFFLNNEGLQYALGRRDEITAEEFSKSLLYRPPSEWRILQVERKIYTNEPKQYPR